MTKNEELEKRLDLFEVWKILDWFTETNLLQKSFRNELYRIWLNLFMSLYQDLTEKVEKKQKRDKMFLYFTNEIFTAEVDKFKWYESEKLNMDIGLIKALETISDQEWYIEKLVNYSVIYSDET